MRTLILALPAGLLLLLGSTTTAAADEQIFTAQNCNRCHSVQSKKIEKKGGAAEESGEEGGVKSPDLSDIGKFHDAAFFKDFLKKTSGHVAHAGNDGTKKHPVKFKGSDEELDKLASWLGTLK